MRFTKTMTINMTIKNTADIFNSEPKQMLLASFNRDYSGICVSGSFIEIGKRIIQMGLVECNIDAESCFVPIEVECDVINYEISEIIVAPVYKILQDGTIFLKTENSVISLKPSINMYGITVGQKIPVVVQNSVYAPFKQITISAISMIPLEKFHTFIVDDSEIDDSKLNEISELNEKLNNFSKTHKNAFAFFQKLLIKTPNKKDNYLDIFDIKKLKKGMIVSRGPEYSLHYISYQNKNPETLPLSADLVANILMTHVQIDLMNICTLIENYEDIKDAKFIWNTYQQKINERK